MSKNIIDGKLVALSASMISTFDATTPFGCEQKGVFKYVEGLEDKPTGSQQLGTDLHALIEHRLREGVTSPAMGEAAGLYLAGQAMIEEVAKRTIRGIEKSLDDSYVAGVKLKGFVDVVTDDGIIDWKTSSDIRRYGKTTQQLATDTQMVLYALAEHPLRDTVKLAHGQFQTKGRKSTDFVEVEVTKQHLTSHRDNVIVPIVERMKVLAADPKQAVKNLKPCFNCSFRAQCQTEGAVMSFFQKFNSASTSSTTPPAPAQVAPPDAPASKPELAAEPVAGFSPIPPPKKAMKVVDVEAPAAPAPEMEIKPSAPEDMGEQPGEPPAKRGRGRPKGSTNKPKDAESQPNPMGLTFKSVTVTKGYTINLGNFNSVRFDVSVTAEGEDLDATYGAVLSEVEAKLNTEAAKYEAEKAKK